MSRAYSSTLFPRTTSAFASPKKSLRIDPVKPQLRFDRLVGPGLKNLLEQDQIFLWIIPLAYCSILFPSYISSGRKRLKIDPAKPGETSVKQRKEFTGAVEGEYPGMA